MCFITSRVYTTVRDVPQLRIVFRGGLPDRDEEDTMTANASMITFSVSALEADFPRTSSSSHKTGAFWFHSICLKADRKDVDTGTPRNRQTNLKEC